VLVGIDDNFFVTEVPVRVNGKLLGGRTLFASLSLFEEERVLETTNIAGQIAEGFSTAAVRFAAEHDIGELKSSHPFDSHPPLADRLEAVGVPLLPENAESLLAALGDGAWYRMIDKAEEIERQQWDDFAPVAFGHLNWASQG
jgi:hypothetical protein